MYLLVSFFALNFNFIMYGGAQPIYLSANIIGQYRPVTDISVLAYMFSDMCRYKNSFLTLVEKNKQIKTK